MPYFCKKPIIIEAEILQEDTTVQTLEGPLLGRKGDYLITGIRGEKYPCKPDIFHATYYEVTENDYKRFRIQKEM